MKILILANKDAGLYHCRKELLECMIKKGYEVYASLPYGSKTESLRQLGVHLIDTYVDRRGVNPLTDLKLVIAYVGIIRRLSPDIILTYTVKPNIYGSMVAQLHHIPYIVNITGLGTAFMQKSLLQLIVKKMYKLALRKSKCVFFQNKNNADIFKNNNIMLSERSRLIPGSGVNLNKFTVMDYPPDDIIKFVFISRIMKEKGIEQYLECAEYIKNKYPNTQFRGFLGFAYAYV